MSVNKTKLRTFWKKLSLAKKTCVILPVLLLLTFVGWRQWRILSIPDIGELFDKQAFLEPYLEQIDENAFSVYQTAQFKRVSLLRETIRQWENIEATYVSGESANWVTRKWARDNKGYLKEFRSATDWELGYDVRPDLLTINSMHPITQDLRDYARLQLVEASLNVSEGNLEDAWKQYRAIFNLSRQLKSNCVIAGLVGVSINALATEPFSYYLASPELNVSELREIQQELNSIFVKIPPVSASFKSESWITQ